MHKRKRQRQRQRVETNSLPRSRAASLNIFLFPDLLPQKTHTLLNLPIFLHSKIQKILYRKYSLYKTTKSSHDSTHIYTLINIYIYIYIYYIYDNIIILNNRMLCVARTCMTRETCCSWFESNAILSFFSSFVLYINFVLIWWVHQ